MEDDDEDNPLPLPLPLRSKRAMAASSFGRYSVTSASVFFASLMWELLENNGRSVCEMPLEFQGVERTKLKKTTCTCNFYWADEKTFALIS